MKNLINFITEKLVINKHSKSKYTYCTSNYNVGELRKIIKERLDEDKNANLNDIDVSQIISMCGIEDRDDDGNYIYVGLFENLDPHNIDISKWDVSNVKNMSEMFYGCKNFNCDLSNWDVSSVEKIDYMFYGCKNFNCDISNWDISNVKNMTEVFFQCPVRNKIKWYNPK